MSPAADRRLAESFLADGRRIVAQQRILLSRIREHSVYPVYACNKMEAQLRTFEGELNVFEGKMLAAIDRR